jgi:hypothetical protein
MTWWILFWVAFTTSLRDMLLRCWTVASIISKVHKNKKEGGGKAYIFLREKDHVYR